MRYLYTFILFISLNISSDNLYYFEDEYDENRFNNLIKDIRCPKCTSGSLSSSNAPISEDLKIKIAEMINENKTDQEIKDYDGKLPHHLEGSLVCDSESAGSESVEDDSDEEYDY